MWVKVQLPRAAQAYNTVNCKTSLLRAVLFIFSLKNFFLTDGHHILVGCSVIIINLAKKINCATKVLKHCNNI